MIDIKPNLAEAVAFAFSLPTDQAHLCAIHPTGNRPVVGRSFPKTEAGQAAALRWLENADRMGYGIYFNANEVMPLARGDRRGAFPGRLGYACIHKSQVTDRTALQVCYGSKEARGYRR